MNGVRPTALSLYRRLAPAQCPGEYGISYSIHAGQVIVVDGTPSA